LEITRIGKFWNWEIGKLVATSTEFNRIINRTRARLSRNNRIPKAGDKIIEIASSLAHLKLSFLIIAAPRNDEAGKSIDDR